MSNISKSPFTDKIEQTDPPRGFTMPHFTPYKGDEDPDQHLKDYCCSTMILYRNNNALLCKFFATTLQGEETIRDYIKRFKAEKTKIVGYIKGISMTTLKNGLFIEHPILEKLIMGEELTMATSYALEEKQALWDEAKQSNKNESVKKHPSTREDSALETFTKFTVPIGQILSKLKNTTYEGRSYQAGSDKILCIPSRTKPHYQRLPEMEAVPWEADK
ncbi:uncharacterized protein LOC126615492 [Malus sylvestris]|uniref:uncharacterized protein LOC126615492 n=1 Tax=Malus sylvestris TaxID=3752 RepID=UPI0021ABA75E|nr:uncharacterized protein LOC126615492 [Malus sylvestris]